ncbi:MAG: hypothetical protein KKG47_02905 [Proteobacteria bacterium]|nr:hypothetical protein [Pseudomonadota bacterium]MBU1737934.1 hypothetical protein [Pseudomonadota bacterium]
MMKQNNLCIKKVLELVREMIILADQGQDAAEDDGCRLLYGVLQDCAYKLRKIAEAEKEAHCRSGKWDECNGACNTNQPSAN